MAADSVGEAIPAKIDPSTAPMSKRGGMMALKASLSTFPYGSV